MADYYTNRKSLIALKAGLSQNGWKIYGYSEDTSDSMTDYYNPASWGGVAVRNGFILVMDSTGGGTIGGDFIRTSYDHKIQSRINKLLALRDNHATSQGEKDNANKILDKLSEKVEIKHLIKSDFEPITYQGNPKGSKWHIEKDGDILAKGVGVFVYASLDYMDNSWLCKKTYYYTDKESYNFETTGAGDYELYMPFSDNYPFSKWKESELEKRKEKETLLSKFYNFIEKLNKIAMIKLGEGEEEKLVKVIKEIKEIYYIAQPVDYVTDYIAVAKGWATVGGMKKGNVYKIEEVGEHKKVRRLSTKWIEFAKPKDGMSYIGRIALNKSVIVKTKPRKNTKGFLAYTLDARVNEKLLNYVILVEQFITKEVTTYEKPKRSTKKQATPKKESDTVNTTKTDFKAVISSATAGIWENKGNIYNTLVLSDRIAKEDWKEFTQYLKDENIGYYNFKAKAIVGEKVTPKKETTIKGVELPKIENNMVHTCVEKDVWVFSSSSLTNKDIDLINSDKFPMPSKIYFYKKSLFSEIELLNDYIRGRHAKVLSMKKYIPFLISKIRWYKKEIKDMEAKITQLPTKKEFNKTLNEAKENQEDFEWYPTPKEVIEVVSSQLHGEHISLLEVGAGNGSFFNIFNSINPKVQITTKYAIEKSKTLINAMDSDIFVIGTDFHEQTFIDKETDAIYCNPPYSEFEFWSVKLIKEANTKTMFLLLPERAEDNDSIKHALKFRGVELNKIYYYDFKNSEFRKARAKVGLYKISFKVQAYHSHKEKEENDPFNLWFNENFKLDADMDNMSNWKEKQTEREEFKSIVKGEDMVKRLVELYNSELETIFKNYRAVADLDKSVLDELEINIKDFRAKSRLRFKGLKNKYWQRIFDNLDTLTDKLTSKSRKEMLSTLTENTNIDFTANNIYGVIIWAIKNANKYFDTQLVEVYKHLSNSKNLSFYKSNKRFVGDNWRFNSSMRDGEIQRYTLDYRTVHDSDGGLDYGTWNDSFKGKLKDRAKTFLSDIFTVAKNLGFNVNTAPLSESWEAGESKNIYLENGDLFLNVRAYKNQNMHLKFSINFMTAFNIEAGRLNGWLKTPKEAAEATGATEEEAKEFFNSSLQLTIESSVLLLGGK